MVEPRYLSPKTIEAAVELLAGEGGTAKVFAGGTAKVFAGGTDLLVQMREELVDYPDLLVDIKNIPETRTIIFEAHQIRIGAAVTGAQIGENPQLKALWPGVVEAVELIGSAQVQNRATIGGNLCNASPAADSVPALIAANARVLIAGPEGQREIEAGEIATGPGKTSLGNGEFVVSVILPMPAGHSGDAYLRFIPRTEMDIAVAGAGAGITLDEGGNCAGIRLALGAIAPTAQLVEDAAKILVNNRLNEPVLEALAQAARDACTPIDDKRGTIEFRTKVAGVLACRVVAKAWHRAEVNA